jgi:cysteinyl-tRNA synthetase
VRAPAPYPEPDPATARFALARLPYKQQLEMTSALLEDAQSILDRWRDRVAQWSRHPSHPIPSDWRTAVIAALDDDLDVARLVAMMGELEIAEDIEAGAKFEAFAFLDRVLSVDLTRDLGRIGR